MQFYLDRAREACFHNAIITGISIAVSCATFSIGIYQNQAIARQVCGATSFVSLVVAAVSRKEFRINQNYLHKATALLGENATDAIHQETRPVRNLNTSERYKGLRSANSPFENNEVFLG